jgi:pyruvate dehydrogenase E2 component (dihydrolipoamide acetyltransferase)
MPDILMPKLSDSMENGTILSWLKATGDQVQIGEEVLEIETDKSTITYTAEDAGVLETLAQEGATVAVGEPIGRIGAGAAESSAADSSIAESPAAELITSTTVGPVSAATNGHGRRSLATPLAKRTAAAYGVDIGAVQGTGPLGRVTRTDVLKFTGVSAGQAAALPTLPTIGSAPPAIPSIPPAPPLAPANPASAPLPPGSKRKESSRLQQLIARRMTEAKATVPHFQVQTEVNMDSAIWLRAELKSLAGQGQQVPSLNDIIIKAAAIALKEHPLANGSFRDDGFLLHDQVNIGVAVAADDALVVPTVFDADNKSLGQIARETRRPGAGRPDLPRRARGSNVHRVEPRNVRDDGDHAGDQPAPGGDSRGGRAA